MSEINDGGPAFPVECQWSNGKFMGGAQTGNYQGWEMGLSVRDYFAAKAMAAHIMRHPIDVGGVDYPFDETMAEWAYAQADAMLRARVKS